MGLRAVLFLLCAHVALRASPFQHELDLRVQEGIGTPTLCMHGYGGSGKDLLFTLIQNQATSHPLIAFNFPNYDIRRHSFAPETTRFGTIDELLPPLYLMKKTVVDEGKDALSLYGFSAGGGALVNCLAVLHSGRFEAELKSIGIGIGEREAILAAVEKGKVLLDVPLKSMDEIIDVRGVSPELAIIAKRYADNGLRPIDALKDLEGLNLDVTLFFQLPDKTLGNRDDELYIGLLKKANAKGMTRVLIADDGGHSAFHKFLWE